MISIIGLFYGVKSDGHYLLFLLYGIYLKMQGAHRGRGFLHCHYEHYNVKYGLLQANVSWPRIVPSRLFGFHSPTLSPSAQSDQSEPPVHCKSTASPLQSTAADPTASNTRTMPSSDRFIN